VPQFEFNLIPWTLTLSVRLHFAAGFFGVQNFQSDYHQLIVIEAPNLNNTLAPYETCNNSNTAVGSFGSVQSGNWSAIYLQDTVTRLQSSLKGINLTVSDVIAMQQLCAYEVR